MATPIRLKVQAHQKADLELIASTSLEAIKAFSDEVCSGPVKMIRLSDFEEAARKTFPAPNAEAITRQLISLSAFARERDLDPDTLLKSIILSVKDLDPQIAQGIEERGETISALLGSAQVKSVMKGVELQQEFDNFLSSAKVMVDLRPIFEDDEVSPVGGVITYNLRVKYIAGDRERSLSIALEEDQILQLIGTSERALKKAEALSNKISGFDEGSVFSAGKERKQ